MGDKTISLCMIVKNEEQNLVDCLASVKSVVDEIIIVDTGSTDRTIDIANQFQAKVFFKPWTGNFSEARNYSLSLATMDWILILDADEKFDEVTITELKKYLTQTEFTAIRILQRNLTSSEDLVRYRDIATVRLFCNHQNIQYEGIIHETVVDSILQMGGTIENTSFILWHSGYSSPIVQGKELRGERNLKLIMNMLEKSPADAYLHYQAGITHKNQGNFQLAREYLLKSLSITPGNLIPAVIGEVNMKLAQIEMQEDRYETSVKFAEASLEFTPDNITSLYLAALGYLSLREFTLAYSFFLRIRQFPEDMLTDSDNLDMMLAFCSEKLKNENSKNKYY